MGMCAARTLAFTGNKDSTLIIPLPCLVDICTIINLIFYFDLIFQSGCRGLLPRSREEMWVLILMIIFSIFSNSNSLALGAESARCRQYTAHWTKASWFSGQKLQHLTCI